jgi:hypothetical protein
VAGPRLTKAEYLACDNLFLGIAMEREPTCGLCGGRLARESKVSVAPGLPLWFDLAWVCTSCSAAYPIAIGRRCLRTPSEPLYADGKRITEVRSGPDR